ncbi:MAG: quinone oxidoreductase [Pigmentiphaga sp.]
MSGVVRFSRCGGPDVLEWADERVLPPGPGQVQIRQRAIGLNFIDIYFRNGLYPTALPSGLGFEAAGEVTALGEGVSHLQVGDRVAYGLGPLGAYAQVRNVPARYVIRVPTGISDEQAAVLMLKGLTAHYLLRQTYRVEAGQTILFHAAAGGVGSLVCQWAKALGVKVIGTASSPQKVQYALDLGAWAMIDYSREPVAERVRELTGGQGVPVVYDGVGQATWQTSLDCLQRRGLLVSFGNASGPVSGVELGVLASKGSLYVTRPTIADYFLNTDEIQRAADELFGLVLDGKIAVHIEQRFALKDAAQAQALLETRKTLGATVLLADAD